MGWVEKNVTVAATLTMSVASMWLASTANAQGNAGADGPSDPPVGPSSTAATSDADASSSEEQEGPRPWWIPSRSGGLNPPDETASPACAGSDCLPATAMRPARRPPLDSERPPRRRRLSYVSSAAPSVGPWVAAAVIGGVGVVGGLLLAVGGWLFGGDTGGSFFRLGDDPDGTAIGIGIGIGVAGFIALVAGGVGISNTTRARRARRGRAADVLRTLAEPIRF